MNDELPSDQLLPEDILNSDCLWDNNVPPTAVNNALICKYYFTVLRSCCYCWQVDSQSYSAADEEEHVEPAVVYQEEGMKFHFYEKMNLY